MDADLGEVPGYNKDVVLLGCPDDQLPSLHPHRVHRLPVDMVSIIQHEARILTADLVVVYAADDLLRTPQTDAEFENAGRLFRHDPVVTSGCDITPDATDADAGRALDWVQVRARALGVLGNLLVLQSGGQILGANVIVFIPYDLPTSDDSVWKQWLGIPDPTHAPLVIERGQIDRHTISWLYYYRFMRWLIESAFPADTAFARPDWSDDTFATPSMRPGVFALMMEIEATARTLHEQMPQYFDPPFLQHDGAGLQSGIAQWLPPSTKLAVHIDEGAVGSTTPHTPYITPAFQLAHCACSSARLCIGSRNAFFFKHYSGSAAFIEDSVRYLYQYGIESLASHTHYTAPLIATHARTYLAKRMRKPNPIVGESAGTLQLFSKLFDTVDAPRSHILIYGPIGAGKEVIFDALEHLYPRDNMLRVIDIAGLDGTATISTLFGHVKGSYTGATQTRVGAVGKIGAGTLVIDNFQNASIEVQAKLLRLLETDGEYQRLGSDDISTSAARIVIAMNDEPSDMVRSRRLLPDLPSRFPIRIDIPDLNSRRTDIPLLVDVFRSCLIAARSWNDDESLLTLHHFIPAWMSEDWSNATGNIRGLQNRVAEALTEIRRSMVLMRGSRPDLPCEPESEETLANTSDCTPSQGLGRPEGSSYIKDHDLADIIANAVASKLPMSLDVVFTHIGAKSRGGHRMARTPAALRERVRRIKDADLRKTTSESLSKLLTYHEKADAASRTRISPQRRTR